MPLPPPLLALPFSASRSGASAPDTRDLKIVIAGSSLAADWPTLLSTQLTAAGKTNTVVNVGHGSYTIKHAGGLGKLIDQIAAEVDPQYDASKACILCLEGVTNDLYYGATSAQAYQYVKDYLDSLASTGWYVIFTTPTKRNNAGTPASFEADRLTFLGLVDADPTFGGRVDAICDLGRDSRMSSTADLYWYNADLVHYTSYSKGLYASLMASSIRTILPSIADEASLLPYPDPWLARATGLLNGSAAAPSNGDAIASWTPKCTISASGAYAQGTGANRPTYDATNTCLDTAASHRLLSTNPFATTTRYTFGARVKFTATGAHLYSLHNQGTSDVRFYANEGAGTYCAYAYDTVTGSLKSLGAGTFSDGEWHTIIVVCDGTDAGHKIYVDGVEEATTTYLAFNGNPSGVGNAVHYLFGSSGSDGATGKTKAIFKSPVPMNAAEIARLKTFLEALCR